MNTGNWTWVLEGPLSEHAASLAGRRASGILPVSTSKRWDVKHISPLATFCMTTEDPNSVLMCVWWLLHSLNPFPGLSMLNFHIASLLRFQTLPLTAQNSLWGPFPILTAPTSPLQLFLQPHKVENTAAELWSPWPCRDRALCLAPCLLSWPQDILLCPVTDIIRLMSCRMGPAQIPLVSNYHCPECDL